MLRRLLFVLFLVACLPVPTCASEPAPPAQPFIQSIFPRGARQGAEVEITIDGKNLAGASRLRFSGTGISAEILKNTPSQITAHLRIAPDAPVGRRDLRVFTPQGTFVQVFQVGALPEILEKEPNDDCASAPVVNLPVVINGKVLAADYDCFQFQARAGQKLIFDLSSSRSGTRFDAMLWLLDSQGHELAQQDDFYFDKDPHLEYHFEKSGQYAVRLSGFREAGSKAAEYRLMIGELPNLAYVFPAGGQRGQTVQLSLAGSNLDQVQSIALEGIPARTEIVRKSPDRLAVRVSLPAGALPGPYRLRVRTAQAEMPNSLVFVVSDLHEKVLAGPPPEQTLDLAAPVVINGAIRKPKQVDNFWIDAQPGERVSFLAEGMSLGNFLDPTLTIFDAAGNVEAYIDESAPNGFDKEPPQLDFHLEHRFEKAGRYRVEFRDAGLRGHDSFVYRLRIGHSDPRFELTTLSNQVSVLEGGKATVPVRVQRLDGWDAPVKVWVEGLPERVESASMTAEPVNTRFRGTFGEDFFFDGTNVDLPLEAHPGAPAGAFPLRVRARGTCRGKTLERTAVVFYPWQQTGYLRGPSDDGELVLTVASGKGNMQ